MSCPRIFGTPPEPVFNMKGFCLSSSLLEELLVTQASNNEEQIQMVSASHGVFKCGQLAECIFIICEDMKQPPETRFLAAELFDRFMRCHIVQLKQNADQKVEEGKKTPRKTSPKSEQGEWKHCIKKLCKQMLAFMVTCVQIASKLCSHYKIVTCRRCAEFLQVQGHRYSTGKVMTSELMVLKTLDYKLSVPSPLSYVETLLEIMGHNDPSTRVKVLHDTCLGILDVCYINRKQLYGKLLRLAIGDSPIDDPTRSKFAAVENDLMLLATATIGAAAYFTSMNTLSTVTDHLARITRIPADDIADFTSTVISVIME